MQLAVLDAGCKEASAMKLTTAESTVVRSLDLEGLGVVMCVLGHNMASRVRWPVHLGFHSHSARPICW
jgi:hypothetical protein